MNLIGKEYGRGSFQPVKSIHNIMPIVIPKNGMEDWIYDNKQMEAILHTVPPELKCERIV